MSDDSRAFGRLAAKYWHKASIVGLIVIGLWKGIPIATQVRECGNALWVMPDMLDSLNRRAFRAESLSYALLHRLDSLEVHRTASTTTATRHEVTAAKLTVASEPAAPVYKELPKMPMKMRPVGTLKAKEGGR
jgi:hypothetical protein